MTDNFNQTQWIVGKRKEIGNQQIKRDGLIISNHYVTGARPGRNPVINPGRLNFSNQLLPGRADNY